MRKVDVCKEVGMTFDEYDRLDEEELNVISIYLSKTAENEKKLMEQARPK